MTFADSVWLAYDCNTVGEDDYEKIQTIKLYHREALQVIEESCNFGDVNSTSGNNGFTTMSKDFKTRFSRMQFSRKCFVPSSLHFVD
ncbi:unnamed protein product [Allacma fusca]|uniref:Uncharacterized protein n=1 Tax=Allacma fusca TaxID=39272 RepID=A0A8J2M7A9_9HEXA|nr:unnamed protein product [Allacma fusca]